MKSTHLQSTELERSLKHFLADESGNDLIEFALSAVLVLTVLFGIMDCSRAIYINHHLAQAAAEAARYAMVRGASWSASCSSASSTNCTASGTNITDYVNSMASAGILPSNTTVNSTWPGTTATGSTCNTTNTNAQGCLVSVQVSYAFQFALPFLPKDLLTMSSASTATIVQ